MEKPQTLNGHRANQPIANETNMVRERESKKKNVLEDAMNGRNAIFLSNSFNKTLKSTIESDATCQRMRTR